MPRLHLQPVPDDVVVPFPQRQADDREAVVRQFSNLLANMVEKHGAFQGRHRYIEASVAAVTRLSFDDNSLHDTRKALGEAFDEELDRLEPPGLGLK